MDLECVNIFGESVPRSGVCSSLPGRSVSDAGVRALGEESGLDLCLVGQGVRCAHISRVYFRES